MRQQRKGYWCGIASIANALEVLGIRRTQREIAKLCNVTPQAGTDEVEMKRALLANGVDVDEYDQDDGKRGYRYATMWVGDCLDRGAPVILCMDQSDHWVTVIGLCGLRFVVFDPSRNSGVEVHSADTLAERWLDTDDGYYGLAISTRTT